MENYQVAITKKYTNYKNETIKYNSNINNNKVNKVGIEKKKKHVEKESQIPISK